MGPPQSRPSCSRVVLLRPIGSAYQRLQCTCGSRVWSLETVQQIDGPGAAYTRLHLHGLHFGLWLAKANRSQLAVGTFMACEKAVRSDIVLPVVVLFTDELF